MANTAPNPSNVYYPTNGSSPPSRPAKPPLHCALCSRDFVHRAALKNHLRTSKAHQMTNFATPRLLAPQMNQINGADRRPGKEINSSYGGRARNHPSVHCAVCNRDFPHDEALALHIKHSKKHRNRSKGPSTTTVTSDPQTSQKLGTACKDNRSTKPLSSSQSPILASGGPIELIALGPTEPITAGKYSRSIGGLATSQSTAIASGGSTWVTAPQPTIQKQSTPVTLRAQVNHIADDDTVRFNVQHDSGSPWSRIPAAERPEALRSLSQQCHSAEQLSKSGYLTREYSQDDIDELRKCRNCGGQQKKLISIGRKDCIFHPWKPDPKKKEKKKKGEENVKKDEPLVYLCCGESGRGCTTLDKHDYAPLDLLTKSRLSKYIFCPTQPHLSAGKRPAIALDCEMAGVVGRRGEVVRICAVDYLTSEVLIDTLVNPIERIVQWRTKYSGVSRSMLAHAKARGRTLNGWKEARAELWKYMDANTILIGQSLNNDLDPLRMVHANVVDSAILTKNVVDPNCYRTWGLKTLCSALLDLDIQKNGKLGHDCMEDTLATREIVLQCTRDPRRLNKWADDERELMRKLEEEREQERKDQAKKRLEEKREKEEKDNPDIENGEREK